MSHPCCPICRKAIENKEASFPFCSKRCKEVDLNRWLSGGYALPTLEEPSEAEIEAEYKDKPDLVH